MAERRFKGGAAPALVAHRGDPRRHPENSLAGFLSALEAGADGVEFDVRLTADGVPVVMHDATVDRTTDGTGVVGSMTLSAVRRLRLRGGGRADAVPTLREALDTMASVGGAVDIEIKNIPGEPDFDAGEERVLFATLAEVTAGAPAEVLVTSFNPATVRRSREADPSVPTGLLTIDAVDPLDGLAAAAAEHHAFLLPSVRALSGREAATAAAAHAAGVRLGTWTADDPVTVSALIEAGVDAIATNDPAMAAATRGRVLTDGAP